MLDAESFDCICLDEAAQCMEAWAWTLLRPEVTTLMMAGDVNQLPALVSRSGQGLMHERSLMERLMGCGYPHSTLTVQNRMAPPLLELINARYGNRLTCGPHAPTSGSVTWHEVADGHEEERDTSFLNEREADEVAAIASTYAACSFW